MIFMQSYSDSSQGGQTCLTISLNFDPTKCSSWSIKHNKCHAEAHESIKKCSVVPYLQTGHFYQKQPSLNNNKTQHDSRGWSNKLSTDVHSVKLRVLVDQGFIASINFGLWKLFS